MEIDLLFPRIVFGWICQHSIVTLALTPVVVPLHKALAPGLLEVHIRLAGDGHALPVHLHRAADHAGVQAKARAEIQQRLGLGRLALVPGEGELAPHLDFLVTDGEGLGGDRVGDRVVQEAAHVLVRRGGVAVVLAQGLVLHVEVPLVHLGILHAQGGEGLAAVVHGHLAVHVVAADLAVVDAQEADVVQLVRRLGRRALRDVDGQRIVVLVDIKVDGAVFIPQRQQRPAHVIDIDALLRLACTGLGLEVDIQEQAQLHQHGAEHLGAGALAALPLIGDVEVAVEFQVQADGGHHAQRGQRRGEHADAEIELKADADAHHAEDEEVHLEVGRLQVATGRFAVRVEDGEGGGNLLGVAVGDGNAQHDVQLELDHEVDAQAERNDVQRVRWQIEGGDVLVHQRDIFGVAALDEVGILFLKAAADGVVHLLGALAALAEVLVRVGIVLVALFDARLVGRAARDVGDAQAVAAVLGHLGNFLQPVAQRGDL